MGSSPLARGLPPPPALGGGAPRIIPARAGFTIWFKPLSVSPVDHPRSRGVYVTVNDAQLRRAGSSPLARGLLIERKIEISGVRIIPARAGFTARVYQPLRAVWDHPRSRGVYPRGPRGPSAPGGSSPLARGLRALISVLCPNTGIIPARAGFTGQPILSATVAQDHPRSRGVYDGSDPDGTLVRGSSPLARGLLPRGTQSRQGRRIIPARAGFTINVTGSSIQFRDHPRSRGVY